MPSRPLADKKGNDKKNRDVTCDISTIHDVEARWGTTLTSALLRQHEGKDEADGPRHKQISEGERKRDFKRRVVHAREGYVEQGMIGADD